MNLLDCVGEPVLSFRADYTTYRKDSRACNTLNKLFNTDFKAVYREAKDGLAKSQWSANKGVSWDAETIYILRKDNKVVCMTNSEWASIFIED